MTIVLSPAQIALLIVLVAGDHFCLFMAAYNHGKMKAFLQAARYLEETSSRAILEKLNTRLK